MKRLPLILTIAVLGAALVACGNTPAEPAAEEKKPSTIRERDAWFTFAAPFTGAPVEQQRFQYRVTGVRWADDSLALVTESWQATRTVRLWLCRLQTRRRSIPFAQNGHHAFPSWPECGAHRTDQFQCRRSCGSAV